MSIADVDGVYVAVGYSSTVGYSSVPKNLATFWNLGDGSLSAAPTTAAIFASSGINLAQTIMVIPLIIVGL